MNITRYTSVGKHNSLEEAIITKQQGSFSFSANIGTVTLMYAYLDREKIYRLWDSLPKVLLPSELQEFTNKQEFTKHVIKVIEGVGFRSEDKSQQLIGLGVVEDFNTTSGDFDSFDSEQNKKLLTKGQVRKQLKKRILNPDDQDIFIETEELLTKYICQETGAKKEVVENTQFMDNESYGGGEEDIDSLSVGERNLLVDCAMEQLEEDINSLKSETIQKSEIEQKIIRQVYSDLQKIKDTEEINEEDVKLWAEDYVTGNMEHILETNPNLDNKSENEGYVTDFLDSYDH